MSGLLRFCAGEVVDSREYLVLSTQYLDLGGLASAFFLHGGESG